MKKITWALYSLVGIITLVSTITVNAQLCSYSIVDSRSIIPDHLTPLDIDGVSFNGYFCDLSQGNWTPSGTQDVTFRYIDESGDESIIVFELTHFEPVILTSFGLVRTTDAPISLQGLSVQVPYTPSSIGVFSGIGVTGSTFTPSYAGVGTHTIYYTVEEDGCIFETSKQVTVEQGITITGFSDRIGICQNAGEITLSASPTGGTYSGTGVSGTSFYPAVARDGDHQITYTADGVSKTVTYSVIFTEQVYLTLPVTELNLADSPITLSGAIPSGGTFSGTGVSGNLFDPSVAGEGTHSITYTFAANGCSEFATGDITVSKGTQNIPPQIFCDGESHEAPADGGVFYYNGNPISSTFTSVIFGGPGTYTALWKKTGYSDAAVTVNILAKPNVSFTGASFCQGDGSISLSSYVSPSGGTFSGTNVSGTSFNANASAGTYSLSYTYDNGSCSETAYATFSITAKPNVSLSLPTTSVYQDASSFSLSGGSPSGGAYYVDGARQTSFNPSFYSVGSHTVTYSYGSGSCSDSDQGTINVRSLLSIDYNDMHLCETDATVTLTDNGGTFYIGGSVLSNDRFNPASFGVGSHTVSWKRTNYSDETFTITVHGQPSVSFSGLSARCVSSSSLDLSSYVNPSGGTFSGTGVSGSTFNPSVATAGTHTIRYSISDSYCSNSSTENITVYDPTSVNLTAPNVTYTDDSPVSLLSYATPTGGTFKVNGATTATLNPSSLGAGTHTITYYYTNAGGCITTESTTVTLTQKSSYVFNDISACTNDSDIPLSNNGGTYTISGTDIGTSFSPSSNGVGTYLVNWGKTGFTDASFTITVNATPVITTTPIGGQCIFDTPLNLLDYVGPKTGSFSGTGVNSTNFNPSTAGAGTHTLTYSVTNSGGCYDEKSFDVTVTGVSSLEITGINAFCSTDGAVDLSGHVNHAGGEFTCTGGGIGGTNLYPGQLSEGTHTLTYIINGGTGCQQGDKVDIVIMDPPSVTLADFDPVYVDAPAYPLTGGSPSGGQYYLEGNLTNTVNPSQLGVGVYAVRYEVRNPECSAYAEKTISIIPLQTNSFQDMDVCLGDDALTLSENGGTYSVDGTTLSGGEFDPSVFGVGNWEVTWEKNSYADTKFIISVHDIPEILTTNQSVCLYSGNMDLTLNVQNSTTVLVTGTGVGSNQYFNPQAAGPGTYDITITASNNYCYTEKTIQVTVQGVESLAFSGLNGFCSTDGEVDLTSFVNHTGGTFSCDDGGVSSTSLYPQQITEGNHTLVYTVNFDGNCTQSINAQFYVMTPPLVTLSAYADVYVDDTPFVIFGGSPSGGQYFINGQLANTVDIGSLGVGAHAVKYVYANAVCEEFAETTLRVLPLEASFSDRFVCFNSEPIGFQDDGGEYSINGVNLDNSFDPKRYGKGTHTITWEKTNYDEATFTITVLENPVVSFSPVGQLCANTERLDLNNFVYPLGGNFTGKGIEQNQYFNPNSTGGGAFEVLYSIEGNGCITQSVQVISVDKDVSLSFNSPSTLCRDAGAIDLNNYVNVSGCNFKCLTGGILNNMLYPSLMEYGQHNIIATYVSGNCTYEEQRDIYILPSTELVIMGMEGPFYQNQEPFYLTSGSPEGGRYLVDGVARSLFDPSVLGVGVHTVTYEYTSPAGCTNQVQKTVTINKPGVDYFSNKSICHGEKIYLPEFAGTFYINSVPIDDGIFDSNRYGAGNYTVTWTKDGFADARFNIKVNPVPDVIPMGIPNLCKDGPSLDLRDYVEPKTGNFSGPGLENSTFFNPSLAGEGNLSLLYTLKNEHCYRELEIPVQVNSLNDISFKGLDIICKNSSPVDLTAFVNPSGGIFSCGDGGVIDNKLFPKMLSVGAHSIFYTVGNSGCSKTEQQLIYIVEPESVTLDPTEFENIYANSQAIYLDIANTTGGIYKVNQKSTNIFDPSVLGSGQHTVSYTYNDNASGCTASGEIKVTVKGEKLSNFGDRRICQNEASLEFDLGGGQIFVDNVQLASGVFDPVNYAPGIYDAVWKKNGYADTGFSIAVSEAPVITVFTIPVLCQNDVALNLYDYVSPKTGTFSGLTLTNSTYFDPSQYKGGSYQVAYTVQNEMCVDIQELEIRVEGPEDIVFEGLPYTLCSDRQPIDLLEHVYPATGTFTNDDGAVISNVLYPSLLTAGIHTLTYTIRNDKGCDQVATRRIYIVEDEPVALTLDNNICQQAGAFIFTGGYPIGGDYYVDGVHVIIFDPSAYSEGLHMVEYRYTNMYGCEATTSQYVTIIESAKVTLQVPQVLCDNGEGFMLKGGYPYGGQYAVNGLYMESFDPKAYGQGEYVLSYEYSNGKCTVVRTQPLTVVPSSPVTIFEVQDLCNNAAPVRLYGGSPSGGYYSVDGQGVNVLDPSGFRPGRHTLTYSLEQNGCVSQTSTNFEILESEDFSINTPSVCENDDVLPLNIVSPSGGQYSGPGVSSNQLDPSLIGAGTYYYEYNYKSSNGCASVVPFTLSVNAAPKIQMPDVSSVCSNANAFTLNATPSGGQFSGNGVVNSVYYPSLASDGIQNITYRVSNKFGCSAEKSKSLLVKEPIDLQLEDMGGICQNGDPVELNFISPAGGVYSGTGVIDNVLYPEKTTPGVKTITYSYTDRNACVSEIQSKVRVRENPDMQDFYLNTLCTNDDAVELNTEMLYTKSLYMGKGVSNNTFDPALSGPGESTVRYLVVDEYGCSNYNEKSIKVKEAPFVFMQAKSYCKNASEVELNGGYPTGGNYTGNFIVNNRFMPLTSGVYDIRYNYTADNGCSEVSTNYVTVNEIPLLEMEVIPNICVNSEALLLQGAAPTGGKYFLEGKKDAITEFNPENYGVGSYTINYKYSNDAGCAGKASQGFQVMDTEDVSIVGLNSQYCSSEESFNLNQKGYPLGGTFRINGTVAYQFEPAHLAEGVNKVEYTYASTLGCSVSTSKSIHIATVPPAPVLDLKSIYCPGDQITIEPRNYVEDYSVFVQTPNSEIQKVENGRKSFSATEVNKIDIYYESPLGCKSPVRSYDIEVEKRNPSFVTEKQNIEKGDALQVLALDDYGYISDYVWTFSDGGISYEPQPYHYFNIPGKNSFYLDYISSAGCTFSKDWVDYIWVNNTDGLTTAIDDKASARIKLYPNPCTANLNIVPGQSGEYAIAIFSKTGELVRLTEGNIGDKTVNVDALTPGAYTLRLIFSDKAASKIFIVQ